MNLITIMMSELANKDYDYSDATLVAFAGVRPTQYRIAYLSYFRQHVIYN